MVLNAGIKVKVTVKVKNEAGKQPVYLTSPPSHFPSRINNILISCKVCAKF